MSDARSLLPVQRRIPRLPPLPHDTCAGISPVLTPETAVIAGRQGVAAQEGLDRPSIRDSGGHGAYSPRY